MALQIRRGTNTERLGITLQEGEVAYVTDFELAGITVTSVDATTNVFTTTLNHGLSVNQKIMYLGNQPNGIIENQIYFVKTVPSATTFTLSTSQGGTTLDVPFTTNNIDYPFATTPTDGAGNPLGYTISPLYVGDGVTTGGNAAGVTILRDLYDVSVGTYGNVGQYGEALDNHDVLQYNSVTNQWENRTDLTLKGVAYIQGDQLHINSDATGADTTITFQGPLNAQIVYANATQRFELNKDIKAPGVIGGNIDIGIATDNTIANSGSDLTISTSLGNSVLISRNLKVNGETLSLNADASPLDSTLYLKGTSNFIRYNNTTGYVEFSDSINRGDLFLEGTGSQGTISTATGALNLNTPSGQPVNVQRDLVVAGNLTVNGTTTSIDTTNLVIEDNMITLNKNETGAGVTSGVAGIEIERGTSSNVNLQWNETDDRWEITTNGTNYTRLPNQNLDTTSSPTFADLTLTGDLAVNGGDITTTAPIGNLYNTGPATVNIGNSATTEVNLGSAQSGSRIQVKPETIVGASTTQAVFNTQATTVNAFGAATAVNIGAATGTTTINNANTVLAGDLAVNGGDITTSSTNGNLFNTNALTVNIGNGATTEVNLGNVSAGRVQVKPDTIVGANTTQAVFNTVATTVNAFGAATALNMAANTGTTTINNNLYAGGNVIRVDNNGAGVGTSYLEFGSASQHLRWDALGSHFDFTHTIKSYADVEADGNFQLNGGTTNKSLLVGRGAGVTVAIRWNETTDRWEFTNNGTTYYEFATQGVNTTDSPVFAGVTAGNIRVGVTGDNILDTTSGGLTITPAITHSGDFTHTGTTATFNNNVTIGSSSADTLTINAATNIPGTFSASTIFGNDVVGLNNLGTNSKTLTLNYDNGTDTTDGFLKINRGGTGADVSLKWNETTDRWQFTNDGSTFNNMLTTSDLSYDLNSLTDVVISSPATGQVVRYNGTQWINSTGSLDDLGDVIISSPVTNQIIKYNGTNWVNSDTVNLNGITLDSKVLKNTSTQTYTTTSQQVFGNVPTATYRSVKYTWQISRGSEFQMLETLVIHDGTNAYITTFGDTRTGANLANFDVDISGSNMRILVTPTSTASTVLVADYTLFAI